jgi:hypothetical protein
VDIDISNPLTQDMSGLVAGHTTSAADEIQRAVPGVKVVKAFNTVFSAVLGSAPGSDSKVQVFYAGDDAGAKDTVRRLAESIGFEPVDGGPLANARYLEPLGMLNIWFGYVGRRARTSRPGGTPPRQLSLWPSEATYSRGRLSPYFPSIIMLPSISLSEWLGPKLSSRLLVSTRCPLLAPSVILPTRWV